MSVYPPPLSQVPIFNPNDFTETVTSVIGAGSTAPTVDYLEFPTAQGAETWTANSGNNELVVGAGSISIGYDVLTVPKGVAFSGQGFAYNNGTVVSNTTWSGLQTKIEAIQALAPASDSTTLNVNDAITIQNGESPTATNTIIISASAGDNQLLLNDDAGTAGYVLTSGGADGSMTWAVGGGSTPSLADVLDVSPAGVANLGQSITIPAGDIDQYLGVKLTMEGDSVIVSANETSTPDEITDQSQLTFQGFSTFRTDTISDPKTQVSNDMTPTYTIIKDISGDLEATATQLTNTMSASSILLQNDSVVAEELTTNSSVEMTNSALTLTSNSYSENPVITSTNVISPTTMVITNGTLSQTTTFSATGMGTDSTTQPLNINAPFTLVSPVISTEDLPLCYTPSAGYGDALVVYNNVGVVPSVSAGFAEVIFQNISATSQSSNIIAICESDGDYMTVGQVSQTGTALYDTLFEIQGAGYCSSTGHQILGANSSSSADKSVVIAYGNGTGGFQVSPSGAIAFDATPLVADGVVSLQDGDFGDAGQYLVSQGDASPPVWTSLSTPSLDAVLTEGNSSDQDIKIQTETFNSGYKSVIRTYEMVSSLYDTTTQVLSNQSTMNPSGFSSQNSADPNTLGNKYTLTPDFLLARHKTATNTNDYYQTPTYSYMLEQIDGGTNKAIYFDTGNPKIELSNTSTTLNTQLTTNGLSFTDNTNNKTTTYSDTGINSAKSPYTINNPTSIGIGTVGTSHTIGIGNETSTTNVSGTFNAPTPATNVNSTIVPTTSWVNTFFATITSLSDYLTTATASATYQTLAGMEDYVTLDYALSTFQTQYGMFLYLTTDVASATYQTIAGMVDYLTTATASATYQTISGLGSALSTVSAITIGTNAGNANTIVIGNNTAPTANFPLVDIKGKFSINDVLFSGGDGGTTQLSVASYTIPQNALRNSSYTLIMSGTANPTTLNFPTDDTGGKYITVFNAGTNPILCSCSASPTRLFFGGGNGLVGASTYAIRSNQTVQFLSAGSSGFILFSQSNSNTNVNQYPSTIQTLSTNQRMLSTRITGASVNGTFTYTSISGQQNFASPASVQLTAEDATGNHTMTLRTNTVAGFTYVSSTGSFPTTLHIYALGV